MGDAAVPVVVIGVGGIGGRTLQALQESRLVDVVGIADKDPAVAERVGEEASVPAYSDYRSVLAEARPIAVFLAVPPMVSCDLIAACAERSIHVWTESPPARDLAEGVAMVQMMDKAELKLAVGTQRRFAVGYRRAWELRKALGEVFLARSHYLFNWGAALGWRGDRASAGGGALLELGYHCIDLLVWLLGLPEEVYGTTVGATPSAGLGGGEPAQAIYDTDDTAAAIMRYASGLVASIVTTRSSGPVSEELSLHGRRGSLRADNETCFLRDRDGNVLDHAEAGPSPVAVYLRQAEAFAQAILDDAPRYECSARENLLNLAVVEAIYLSDRTAQPEDPHQLLQTHGLTVEECLASSPWQACEDEAPIPLPDADVD